MKINTPFDIFLLHFSVWGIAVTAVIKNNYYVCVGRVEGVFYDYNWYQPPVHRGNTPYRGVSLLVGGPFATRDPVRCWMIHKGGIHLLEYPIPPSRFSVTFFRHKKAGSRSWGIEFLIVRFAQTRSWGIS